MKAKNSKVTKSKLNKIVISQKNKIVIPQKNKIVISQKKNYNHKKIKIKNYIIYYFLINLEEIF